MSIENRVISVLQSALRADVLPDGYELNTPYAINAVNGLLLDCNDAFFDLVARRNLAGTHFSERCPRRFVEQIDFEQFQRTKESGLARVGRPIVAYDGKIHNIIVETQMVALGGTALFLSSISIEAHDVGKISNRKKGQVYFLSTKASLKH